MLCMTVVLLPKGDGDYYGIGILEPFWKVVDILIDKQMKVVKFHGSFHGLLGGRDTGMTAIEAKLAQQWAYIKQASVYGIFLSSKGIRRDGQ